MAVTTRRRRLIGGSAAAAIVLAAGVLGIVDEAQATAAHQAAALQRAIPPASASPEQVLDVYLRAAKAHDCILTAALMAPGTQIEPWCGGHNPANTMLGDAPEILDYSRDGGSVGDNCYPVDITQTGVTGAEPGDLPGWEFCFVHTPEGWRLNDEGYG